MTVTETAGIRRFGYPVSAVIELQTPVPDIEHFRLIEHGKPVAAQFRPMGDPSRAIRAVSLDVNVSHAPLETRTYVVEYDSRGVPAAPRKGLRVIADGDVFRIRHPGDLEFVVPRNLLGLLTGVRSGKTEYLRPRLARVGNSRQGQHRLPRRRPRAIRRANSRPRGEGGAAGCETSLREYGNPARQ